MKKLLFVVAVCAVSTPALAQSRGGVVNSARIDQAAGAFAFMQIGQGERVTIDSPRNDPLVRIDSGAFVMPYIVDSFNASGRGADVRTYDPVGSYIAGDVRVRVDVDGYVP